MPADEWASKHELAIEVGGAVEPRERVPERVEAQRDQSVPTILAKEAQHPNRP